jgi:hypothetical protein
MVGNFGIFGKVILGAMVQMRWASAALGGVRKEVESKVLVVNHGSGRFGLRCRTKEIESEASVVNHGVLYPFSLTVALQSY